MSRRWSVVTVLLIFFFIAPAAFAQTAGGTILGKVTDQTGGILPGADITIKNTATGITRSVLSNETGIYSAPNLQPGTYEVKAELPSFNVELRKDVNLSVGSEMVIDFSMHVAGSAESVEVTAQDARVDLVASTVSRMV